MVKEYCRPAPGRIMSDPSELRPADVLLKTVNYLFHNIILREDVPWYHVYEFVFDRLRAVRQDMVIQRIGGNAAIWILESIVRFLIYAGYRLCMEPVRNFDPEINRIHTVECLKRLMILYDEDGVCHCRQGQFVALYILYNIDSDDAVFTSLQLKDTLLSCDSFKTSLSLSLAWRHRNFIQVFRLLTHLPFLHFCAVHRHLDNFRWCFAHLCTTTDRWTTVLYASICSKLPFQYCKIVSGRTLMFFLALQLVSSAVGNRAQQLQLSLLARWFGCSTADVKVLCTSCGFTVNKDVASVSHPSFKQVHQVQALTCNVELRDISSQTLSDWLYGETCTADCSARTAQ